MSYFYSYKPKYFRRPEHENNIPTKLDPVIYSNVEQALLVLKTDCVKIQCNCCIFENDCSFQTYGTVVKQKAKEIIREAKFKRILQ
jgi:hypothetical protein